MLPGFLSSLAGSQIALVAALIAASFVTVSYVKSWYRLRRFPGPALASFSYLWMLRRAVNDKYGTLVRVGPNDLITDDPEVVRRMNGARSSYRRSSWYNAMKMDPYGVGLFSTADTAADDKLKAKLSFGYGGKECPHLERDIDEQLAGLVRLIRTKYIPSDDNKTLPLDVGIVVQYFTLDAITKIAYGKEFGYLAADKDIYDYIKTCEEQVPSLVVMAELPFLARIFLSPWVLKLIGPKKTDPAGMGKLLGVAEQVVASRLAAPGGGKDARDMLGAFLRHGVTRRECEIEVPFQIIAGSDTTATAIRATLLFLASSRRAYGRLQQEIDAAAAEGRISSPVTAEEGKKMEYLQAVIYEGLRMQIPFSGLVMKEVPPGGDIINGLFVPGGTRVAHNTLAMQRRRDIFGDDVDVFRPERWLNADPVSRQRMVQTTELVFGHGRLGCLGKPVAFLELNKIYVELLRRFDFQIINPRRPWHEMNDNMFFQSQLWMRVTERFPSE
ncbi:cytochrome P450 [Lasiosphaeria ovina]|uniref:Cytochrome P450 monooxygenase ABA1 n=1 Tax=Lasiosphaeria ovina TaxID=92902 RepID=A0AAE0KG33_9PEZI|nr:cytochrome P450 [Lasiosphaeria ovina]